MKKMGIEQQELSGVQEVIFRFKDKQWIIEEPQVVLIKQAGIESYQVTGSKKEVPLAETQAAAEKKSSINIPKEDAMLVASQAGVSIEEAMRALTETEGDLAAAILKLKHR